VGWNAHCNFHIWDTLTETHRIKSNSLDRLLRGWQSVNWPRNTTTLNPLNTQLNPLFHLLELLVHHILHISRIRVNVAERSLLHSYTLLLHQITAYFFNKHAF
jgi:hypothetical protein